MFLTENVNKSYIQARIYIYVSVQLKIVVTTSAEVSATAVQSVRDFEIESLDLLS